MILFVFYIFVISLILMPLLEMTCGAAVPAVDRDLFNCGHWLFMAPVMTFILPT